MRSEKPVEAAREFAKVFPPKSEETQAKVVYKQSQPQQLRLLEKAKKIKISGDTKKKTNAQR